MKAACIDRTGGPEVIRVVDLPDPRPGPSQVVVRVRACGLNPIDTYIRAGTVAMPLSFPHVVGCDLAGEVLAVGEGVDRFRVGDRVWGSNQGILGRQGTFAELACVEERWLYPTPAGVSDRTAAASALVGITAHLGLVRHAGLRAGETIFVDGGSGGVGSMVVQIAKRLGGHVIATAANAERRERVLALGADSVFDRSVLDRSVVDRSIIDRGGTGNTAGSSDAGNSDAGNSDIASRVLEVAPGGVDVYWESLREPDFDAAVRVMAEGGRMVLMAGRDARPPFPVGPFYVKGCRLIGFVMFKASWQQQAAAAADLNRWMAAGLAAPIAAVMPLAAAAEAHALQERGTIDRSGGTCGKIVIEP